MKLYSPRGRQDKKNMSLNVELKSISMLHSDYILDLEHALIIRKTVYLRTREIVSGIRTLNPEIRFICRLWQKVKETMS
jgi:hypothetical protein